MDKRQLRRGIEREHVDEDDDIQQHECFDHDAGTPDSPVVIANWEQRASDHRGLVYASAFEPGRCSRSLWRVSSPERGAKSNPTSRPTVKNFAAVRKRLMVAPSLTICDYEVVLRSAF